MESPNPYLYNPKTTHAGDMFPQMESESYKPPFYFGGSQVPETINPNHLYHATGSGINKYIPTKKFINGPLKRVAVPIHQKLN